MLSVPSVFLFSLIECYVPIDTVFTVGTWWLGRGDCFTDWFPDGFLVCFSDSCSDLILIGLEIKGEGDVGYRRVRCAWSGDGDCTPRGPSMVLFLCSSSDYVKISYWILWFGGIFFTWKRSGILEFTDHWSLLKKSPTMLEIPAGLLL